MSEAVDVKTEVLIEAVARRLSRFEHPRTEWPDEMRVSVGDYRAKVYRERYIQMARVLINMIRED